MHVTYYKLKTNEAELLLVTSINLKILKMYNISLNMQNNAKYYLWIHIKNDCRISQEGFDLTSGLISFRKTISEANKGKC